MTLHLRSSSRNLQTVCSILKYYVDDYAKALDMIKSTCHFNQEEELPDEDESFVKMDTTSMLLRSIVNTEAKEMVRSIGGLLLFLTTFLGKDHFEGDHPTLSIHSFISIDLDKYMSIDRVTNHISFHTQNTLQYLDIFMTVNHPSLVKGMGREKQGFTIFSLLDQTHCALGRRLLKQFVYSITMIHRWILCPSNNAEEITSRHDTLTFMQQPQLKEMVVSLQREIQRIADLPLVVRRITSQRGSNSDWIRLMDSVSSVLECGRLLDVMRKYTDVSK